MNDPVNASDPSGLQGEGCNPWPLLPFDYSGAVAPPPPPPSPSQDPWASSVHESSKPVPAVAWSVTARRLTLAGLEPLFSDPQKLHPDAIAQIALNKSVGTGDAERLRWTELTADEARRFLDEGAMVAIGTQQHWMTVVRDPFAGR